MRLFTGIALPPRVVGNIEKLLRTLRPAADFRWSTAKNLHITTKFIGDWEEERLEEVQAALAAVPPPGEIEITVRGLGWFPNDRAPRVFWAGVEAGPGLYRLAEEIESRLAPLGIAREGRKLSPHLTLARIKGPADLEPLKRMIAAMPVTDFGGFTADRFHLYESHLTPHGSVYTSLDEFYLKKTGDHDG